MFGILLVFLTSFSQANGDCFITTILGDHAASQASYSIGNNGEYVVACDLTLEVRKIQNDEFSLSSNCTNSSAGGFPNRASRLKIDGTEISIWNKKNKSFDKIGICDRTSFRIEFKNEDFRYESSFGHWKLSLYTADRRLVLRWDGLGYSEAFWLTGEFQLSR